MNTALKAFESLTPEQQEEQVKPLPFETYKTYLTRIAPLSGHKKTVWRKAIKAMLQDAKVIGIQDTTNAVQAVQAINDRAAEMQQMVQEKLDALGVSEE